MLNLKKKQGVRKRVCLTATYIIITDITDKRPCLGVTHILSNVKKGGT